MSLTTKQKIARKEQELAQLKTISRKEENGQKFILGGLVLSIAREDSQFAKELLGYIDDKVTRQTDLKRLDNIIVELKKIANENHQPNFMNNN